MGRLEWTQIRWRGRPPARARLVLARAILHALDPADAPALTELGMDAAWRNPITPLAAVLDVLHVAGFPCEGRRAAIDDLWWSEPPEGTTVKDLVARRIDGERWERSVDVLPALEPFHANALGRVSARLRRLLPEPPSPLEARLRWDQRYRRARSRGYRRRQRAAARTEAL